MSLPISHKSNPVSGLIASAAPIVFIASLYLWFSIHPLTPSPQLNAATGNPLGFLVSNFVYDGVINLENIGASCIFLLFLFLFCPKHLRIISGIFFPFIVLFSGSMTELAAISACGSGCSFYGMSGAAGGAVGFTIACTAVTFGYLLKNERAGKLKKAGFGLSLIVYVVLLLFFAGFVAFPTSPQTQATSPISPTTQPASVSWQQPQSVVPVLVHVPSMIAQEPRSVQIGHGVGVLSGLLFFVALFVKSSRSKVLEDAAAYMPSARHL